MSKLLRHSLATRQKTATAVGAAIAIHAVLIGSVNVFGADLRGSSGGTRDANGKLLTAAEQMKRTEIAETCKGNVLLATTARAALCLAPWQVDTQACMDLVSTQMWFDLSGCTPTDIVSTIQVVPNRETPNFKPIDAEQLIEQAEQLVREEQQKPPDPQLQPQQPAPPPPPPPPPVQRNQQIVETTPTNDEAPENTRFLAEHNSKVEKQKVARGSVDEPLINKPKPEELTAKQNPQETPQVAKLEPDRDPGRNEKAPDKPGPLSMRKPGDVNPSETPQEARERGSQNGNQGTPSPDGYIQKRGDGSVDQVKQDPGEKTRGEGGAGGGAPRVPDLTDQKEILERVAGGGSVDHLEDVEEGDENSLNAKQFVHATFFNRMKRSVAQHWDPSSVMRAADPDGSKYGVRSRVTGVRVSLDKTGAVKKVMVIRASEVSVLDDEAVRAFKAASPFPNPPEQLVGKDGLITFDFGFHVENNVARTSWRTIRQ